MINPEVKVEKGENSPVEKIYWCSPKVENPNNPKFKVQFNELKGRVIYWFGGCNTGQCENIMKSVDKYTGSNLSYFAYIHQYIDNEKLVVIPKPLNHVKTLTPV